MQAAEAILSVACFTGNFAAPREALVEGRDRLRQAAVLRLIVQEAIPERAGAIELSGNRGRLYPQRAAA